MMAGRPCQRVTQIHRRRDEARTEVTLCSCRVSLVLRELAVCTGREKGLPGLFIMRQMRKGGGGDGSLFLGVYLTRTCGGGAGHRGVGAAQEHAGICVGRMSRE